MPLQAPMCTAEKGQREKYCLQKNLISRERNGFLPYISMSIFYYCKAFILCLQRRFFAFPSRLPSPPLPDPPRKLSMLWNPSIMLKTLLSCYYFRSKHVSPCIYLEKYKIPLDTMMLHDESNHLVILYFYVNKLFINLSKYFSHIHTQRQ